MISRALQLSQSDAIVLMPSATKTIESLREYLLVWQDKKRVARYTKADDGSWVLTDFIGDEATIHLTSVDASLTIEDIYDKVIFK